MKKIFFLRDGVIAASAPRIAGDNTLQSEPATLERTVFADGFDAIVGTGGRVAARAPDERRQGHLVEFDKPYHDGRQTFAEEVIQFSHPFWFPKLD